MLLVYVGVYNSIRVKGLRNVEYFQSNLQVISPDHDVRYAISMLPFAAVHRISSAGTFYS